MNVKGYRDKILDQLKEEGKELRKLLTQPTTTWSTAVRFRTDTRVAGNRAEVKVTTKDKRFVFLDLGTKKPRWAVMNKDFRPKTTVRSLKAGRGSGNTGRFGGTVIRGRTHMQNRGIRGRPGIKARNFSIEARKIRRPLFFVAMRAAMARAAEDSF